MKTKPPPDRHVFKSSWDEISHVYDKVLYWLYQRESKSRARPFAARLKRLLSGADRSQESVLGQECRSLICEINNDLPGAIKHRNNEIRHIYRLREISVGTPNEDYVLNGYGLDDLSDRLDLLAVLYHDNGELDKAIATLHESKHLCDEHDIEFDGDELLRDYLDEKRNAAAIFSRNGTTITKNRVNAIHK
jgi:hypothetical protein